MFVDARNIPKLSWDIAVPSNNRECAMEAETRRFEQSAQTLFAVSASEGLIPSHQSLLGLIAKADSAPRRLRRVRSCIGRWGRQLWITRWGQRLLWTIPMRANEGICSVEITSHCGFFAQMNWCLFILQYCERHDLIPDLRLAGGVYLDHNRGPNWLDYYFDVARPMMSEELARRVRYTKTFVDFKELWPPIAPVMSVDEGARILRQYLSPKPHINALVDDFWRSLGVNGHVVGIHFRGTDKSSEAPRVSWEHCLNILRTHLRNDENIKAVFVASDEQEFIKFIVKSVTDFPVYYHDDHYRNQGSDEMPVHHVESGGYEKRGGYEKGEDALINGLLLSRCSTLIRTTSFLSAWASIFNPELKVILLNKPYDGYLWYPESEIVRSRNTKYLPESPV